MKHEFEFVRGCSLDNVGNLPMDQALLKQEISSGNKRCPVKGETFKLEVSNPAANIRRREAAWHCSGGCQLCGRLPEPQDFNENM